MIYDPLDHEKRSREVADSTRRFIIGANTGAIAAVLAVSGKLMDGAPPISPRWAMWPLFWFVLSFALVYTSMVFAKGREIARVKAAKKLGHKPGDVADEDNIAIWRRSSFWDTYAALLLALGVVWALCQLFQLVP